MPEPYFVVAIVSLVCAVMIDVPILTRWLVANITIDEVLRRVFDDDVDGVTQLIAEHERTHAMIVIDKFFREGYEPAIALHDRLEAHRHRHRALLFIALFAAIWASYAAFRADFAVLHLAVSVGAIVASALGIFVVDMIDHNAGELFDEWFPEAQKVAGEKVRERYPAL